MNSAAAFGHLSADEQHVMVPLGLLADQSRREILAADVDGLRSSQFRVIAMVPPGGVTVTELADRVGMTKQGMGQFVTALVDSGHLAVGADADDRRIRRVRRTARGDASVTRLAAVLREMEAGWAQSVGAARYAEFRSVLEQLAELRPA